MPKILVADDNEEMLETLSRIFSFYQFEVITAVNGQEAVDLAVQHRPDLIILDGMMPVMDGFEACKTLKSKNDTKEIPIIFLTAQYTDPEHRVAGLELGCDDYMLKPFNSKELVTRAKTILKRAEILKYLKSENEQLADRNARIQGELQALMEKARQTDKDSFIDQLTGLYSYSFFTKRLREEFVRAKRHQKNLSLVIAEINNLEQVEEEYGQQVAHYVLMKLANNLLNRTRTSDVLASDREGRFFVILPETDRQGAFQEAERIRIVLDNPDFSNDEILSTLQAGRRKKLEHLQLHFNLGVETYNGDRENLKDEKELLQRANLALKKSKSEGPNRTGVLDET
ncbi:MAG TPA: response regulator [Caldithrix abyssi]|uniref:Response regulator n=1 Tax=Caldithrix abyssi TaxID=187145 RepID=A0A7V5PP09_CALAY|nr:response regulator [Caldithrix abyssi]